MHRLKIFFVLVLAMMTHYAMGGNEGSIIPRPQSVELRSGEFTILTTTKITHYPSLRPLAQYLAEYVPLEIREYNAPTAGDIVLMENMFIDRTCVLGLVNLSGNKKLGVSGVSAFDE